MSVRETFVEKILGAPEGAIVFRRPDLVLTHDNTASIRKTFEKMGGKKVFDPGQLFVALDHNAPPTNAKLASDYRAIRDFVKAQGIKRFYDAGRGVCHQLMGDHARPGMIIIGSDSHTCTAGAFNTLAVGCDRTEAAGLFNRGETWFRVPPSMKITLKGAFRPGVYAKDLSLWIIGKIGAAGANYLSIEFHGDGVQLFVIPVSQAIYLHAMEEGIMATLVRAGATILASSCGPCLGSGQGIPAYGHTVISTANRNFQGRMGNVKAAIYLASPATVAVSAAAGCIADPRGGEHAESYRTSLPSGATPAVPKGENRRLGTVWNYADADHLNTDQMFAGSLVYNILSSDPPAIRPHLFKGFDVSFAENVRPGDIILAGENFGCGSSREHPAAGLADAGVKAVLVKSVNRIFYRAAINQGLLLIVHREAVEAYRPGDAVEIDFKAGRIRIGDRDFGFEPLPAALMEIIDKKGLVNWLKDS